MPYFSQGPVQYLAGRRHSINTCGKRSRREIEGEKKRGGREREKKKEEEEEGWAVEGVGVWGCGGGRKSFKPTSS